LEFRYGRAEYPTTFAGRLPRGQSQTESQPKISGFWSSGLASVSEASAQGEITGLFGVTDVVDDLGNLDQTEMTLKETH